MKSRRHRAIARARRCKNIRHVEDSLDSMVYSLGYLNHLGRYTAPVGEPCNLEYIFIKPELRSPSEDVQDHS